MSAKRAKLTGIHHFFKPAVEATSAAVDCDSGSDNDSTSTRSDTPSTSTCTHVEYVVENTLDKHHGYGGGVAGGSFHVKWDDGPRTSSSDLVQFFLVCCPIIQMNKSKI